MFGTTDAARRRGFPQRGRWNCDLHLPAAAGLAGLTVMVATAAIAPAARTTAVTSASATVPQLAGVTVGIDGMKALARGLVAPQLDAGAVDQTRSVASERSILVLRACVPVCSRRAQVHVCRRLAHVHRGLRGAGGCCPRAATA